MEVVDLCRRGRIPVTPTAARLHRRKPQYHADWILCDTSPLEDALEEDHLEAIVRRRFCPSRSQVQLCSRSGAVKHRRKVAAKLDDPGDVPSQELQTQHQALLDGAYAGYRGGSRQAEGSRECGHIAQCRYANARAP